MITAFIASGGLAGFIATIPNGWWIAIGTFCGGLALKAYEKWLNRAEGQRAAAKDYRDTIKELNADVDAAEKAEHEWRAKALAGEEEAARLRRIIIHNGIDPSKNP